MTTVADVELARSSTLKGHGLSDSKRDAKFREELMWAEVDCRPGLGTSYVESSDARGWSRVPGSSPAIGSRNLEKGNNGAMCK